MPKLPAFTDVQQVMDQAALRPTGLRYRLKRWGEAVNFRQRCYKFRAAAQRHAREQFGLVPGYIASTPYDSLELRIEDDRGVRMQNKPTPGSKFFDVVIRHREAHGEVLDIDTGETIDLNAAPEGFDNDRSLDLE